MQRLRHVQRQTAGGSAPRAARETAARARRAGRARAGGDAGADGASWLGRARPASAGARRWPTAPSPTCPEPAAAAVPVRRAHDLLLGHHADRRRHGPGVRGDRATTAASSSRRPRAAS
ncbi:MAG: hypothetical protein MZW92_00070 [Comamonadaceae bacterium]|nr:hypothetical protein [Comamonadaceae bacterium]